MVLPGWLDHQTIFCAGSTPSQSVASRSVRAVSPPTAGPPPQAARNPVAAAAPPRARMLRREEIGRASCRERGEGAGGAGSGKKRERKGGHARGVILRLTTVRRQ